MGNLVDAGPQARIAELGKRVLDGGQITREEALWLIGLENNPDILDLIAWANRIRERFKGNKIHLCSIVNAKAGACPEDCKFCAQSAFYQTDTPRYGFIDPEPVQQAADEARKNQVSAVGLVAAWKGIKEGPLLDEICDRIRELADTGKTRPDASLGTVGSQEIANRLKEAGLECYGHNLETSRRFFPEQCTTHSYDERIQTIHYLKNAGVKICSGGIIGMGETREDRCDLALELRAVGASVVPLRKGASHSPDGGPQNHRLLPHDPAEKGDHGGWGAHGEPSRSPKHDLCGRRQRADGGQLPDHPESTGRQGSADAQGSRLGAALGRTSLGG